MTYRNQLFIDGLKVPVEDRIGEEGRGFEYILHGMNPERILIGAESVGLGRCALARAANFGLRTVQSRWTAPAQRLARLRPEAIVTRRAEAFRETRRRHPLAEGGEVLRGIEREPLCRNGHLPGRRFYAADEGADGLPNRIQ